MSKVGMPHWRYIALHLDAAAPLDRKEAGDALGAALQAVGVQAQLTRFGWPHAIVRVHHHDLAAARATLPRLRADARGRPLSVQTLLSSGTILTLTRRLGVLETRGSERGTGRA